MCTSVSCSTHCALGKSGTDKHLVHFPCSYLRTMILVFCSPLTTNYIRVRHIIASYFPKLSPFQSSLLFQDNIKNCLQRFKIHKKYNPTFSLSFLLPVCGSAMTNSLVMHLMTSAKKYCIAFYLSCLKVQNKNDKSTWSPFTG